jgi:hypothetical protein
MLCRCYKVLHGGLSSACPRAENPFLYTIVHSLPAICDLFPNNNRAPEEMAKVTGTDEPCAVL